MQIEHIPGEKRPTNRIWWVAWGIVALGWIWYFTYRGFDRDSLALGGLTGMVLATWAIEVTGNKLPSWMIPPRKKKVRYLPDPIPGTPLFGTNAKRFFLLAVMVAALVASIVWMTP